MDEDSMVSCELLAHLEHRHAELRRGVPLSVRKARPRDEEEYEIRPLAQVPDDIAARPWGGFRFVYKIGDVNQLPPVLSTSADCVPIFWRWVTQAATKMSVLGSYHCSKGELGKVF